ncbi:hypothetical protein VTP01DRAFT_2713 [Rhizomucor pusillus]|uniref:uncharacterized protein n=1 Tax=Rhizomucor pusillus TaxID=4840 RepID=UPI0037421E98
MHLRSVQLDDPSVETYCIPGARVYERFFQVPLDYKNDQDDRTIQVFARHLTPLDKRVDLDKLPFLLYLQGGPGFEVALPSSASSGWIKVALSRGYQVLLLDQRGTGLSTPISAKSLAKLETDDAKFEYLTHFRADNIVHDCELIRQELTVTAEDPKFSLIGQSFGGFCITTYLSLYPESIREAFITGGVPPLVNSPDPVYRALYPRVLKRNKIYYEKYPRDVARVRKIHEYLSKNTVTLPNGGTLSPRRFLQLGIAFGQSGGYDQVHEFVLYAAQDLERDGELSYKSLNKLDQLQDWDTNVIYAILHEAIYCQDGQASNWSAERLRSEMPEFEWRLEHLKDDQPVYFTGEMIYPFMLDDYAELRPLKNVAERLATYEGWGKLYDEDVLKGNEVPVAGVSYFDDMYVDLDLSQRTASKIKGFQAWVTNEYAHNGVRKDGERVFTYLIKLLAGDESYDR